MVWKQHSKGIICGGFLGMGVKKFLKIQESLISGLNPKIWSLYGFLSKSNADNKKIYKWKTFALQLKDICKNNLTSLYRFPARNVVSPNVSFPNDLFPWKKLGDERETSIWYAPLFISSAILPSFTVLSIFVNMCAVENKQTSSSFDCLRFILVHHLATEDYSLTILNYTTLRGAGVRENDFRGKIA